MSGQFRAACIQMNGGDEIIPNLAAAIVLIREAHRQGADFIATPEVTNLIESRSAELHAKVRREDEDETLRRLRALAAELACTLLIGSLALRLDAEKLVNRSFLIAPDGSILARYDKIHLFDVDIDEKRSFRESKNYAPGDRLVLAEAPIPKSGRSAKIGLTICYDLRFPQLYRALAKAGAELITVPSAFTKVTGEAHWHVLLRARAIECGAFILAPAHCGAHPRGRESYGHSLIISPWGEILADGGIQPGVALADIDLSEVARVRAQIPSLKHDRAFGSSA
jgi:predicted amidohydrolase